MDKLYAIEMFYDGDCPLCMRETRILQRLDRHQRLRFTNIAAPTFDASSVGKPQDELMDEMHGRLPDGSWVTGVEVFRRLYSAVGFSPVVWLTRLPIIKQLLNVGYFVFAKYRRRLTGRCNENCSIDPKNVAS
jgi:predicted DCC family thiol-disulfide oxidoreductase YuxK